MKNIIFIAPPAAGKGTQSELLVEKYGYAHISTGDLLRERRETQDEIGKEIAETQDAGGIVRSEIVNAILKDKLASLDKPFVLDGYPRTLDQVATLEEITAEINKPVELAIYLSLPEEVALRRACGRISCPECNRIYHKQGPAAPQVEGICDTCNVALTSRNDDNEEAFKARFQSYLEKTSPLIKHYEEKGLLINIDIDDDATPDSTFAKLEEVL